MRNLKSLLLTVALLLGTALAASAQEWTKYAPEGGRFEVMLPGTPEKSASTTQSEHGPYTTTLFILRTPGTIWMVGYVDYDPGFNFSVKAEIVANKDNFLKGMTGSKELTKRDLTLDGSPGMEFTAELDEGRRFMTSRIFVVGRRPYQMVAITAHDADQTGVLKFLDSFKVTKK